METATAWHIYWAWDFAAEHLALFATLVWVCLWDCIKQKLGVRVQRVVVDILFIANFADAAEEHYHHAVCDKVNDRKVMADEQVGHAMLFLERFEQVEHLTLHRNIKRRNGLVADDKLWLQCDGTCNADALALPTRELMWVAVQKLNRHANLLHELNHARGGGFFVRTDFIGFEWLCNDIAHFHAGVKACVWVLEDHLHFRAIGAERLGIEG